MPTPSVFFFILRQFKGRILFARGPEKLSTFKKNLHKYTKQMCLSPFFHIRTVQMLNVSHDLLQAFF